MAADPRLEKISSTIREIPNWPKEGILFQVSPLSSSLLVSSSHPAR